MSMPIEKVVGEFLMKLSIRTEEENETAIEHLEGLTERWEAGEAELEPIIDYLTQQIVRFEEEHYPMEKPTPASMLSYFMEQHGHKQGDLKDIAPQSVISDILSGKRDLNLGHIRKLAEKYHTDPSVFI